MRLSSFVLKEETQAEGQCQPKVEQICEPIMFYVEMDKPDARTNKASVPAKALQRNLE
jgi:hypothetical protein